ncbi:hypothetical protein ACWEFJ_38930 [Actinosynnema sp. NPDC004786]
MDLEERVEESSLCCNGFCLRRATLNWPVAKGGDAVSAGQLMIGASLGVKGSQVQILSSRRSEEARWIWMFVQVSGLFRARVSIFTWSRNGIFSILVNGVLERNQERVAPDV